MKIEEILEKKRSLLSKSFVDIDGNVYSTNSLHEMLAIEICEKKGWDWQNYYNYATDYLLYHKAFIKIANYDGCTGDFHYVSFAIKFKKTKRIRRLAEFIADSLKLKIFYEEET